MTAGHQEWSALEGAELLAIDDAGAERTVVLESVSPVRDSDGWLAYTLAFRGDADFPPTQQTHRLSAAGLEESVFLVPVAGGTEGIALEAVFAQQRQQAPRRRHEED